MLLNAINMPAWLVDFWTVYGDMITPVLVTLALAVVTWIALSIKTSAKVNSAKADLQIQALKEVANREDNKPQLDEQNKRLNEIEEKIGYFAEMLNTSFQNSNLDPEVKNNLTLLNDKIKYGTKEELILKLEEEKNKLTETVKTLTDKVNSTVVTPVKEEIIKRTRR